MASAPPSSPKPGSGGGGGEEGQERFGPLGLRRLVKEDGRALILYVRVDPAAVADLVPKED